MKHPITWLGVAVSLLSALYFLRATDPTVLWASVAGAQPVWLTAGTVLFCVSVAVRGPRWHRLVRNVCQESTTTVTAALMVGFLANRIFFGRLGEIIRCLVLARKSRASVTGLLATVAVEKVVDLVALAVCISLVLVLWAPNPAVGTLAGDLARTRNVWLLAGLTGFVLLSVLAWWPAWFQGLLTGVSSRLAGRTGRLVLRMGHACLDGLAALRSGGSVVYVYGCTAIVWFLVFLSEWCVVRAFDPGIPAIASLVLTVAIACAVAPPQAPGYIGVFWVVVEKTLVLGFGVADQTAKAIALTLWLLQMVPIAFIGLGCLWWLETSFQRARTVLAQARTGA